VVALAERVVKQQFQQIPALVAAEPLFVHYVAADGLLVSDVQGLMKNWSSCCLKTVHVAASP
jgi:hypothetical protein